MVPFSCIMRYIAVMKNVGNLSDQKTSKPRDEHSQPTSARDRAEFERQMIIARQIMAEDRDMLAQLAKM